MAGASTTYPELPPGTIIDSTGDPRWQIRSFSSTGQVTFSRSDALIGINVTDVIDIKDIAVLGDGSILLAGGGADIEIVKLKPDGATDTAFGADGKATAVIQGDGSATHIALAPDGAFYVLANSLHSNGVTTTVNLYLARFSASGHLDTHFGEVRSIESGISGTNADLALAGSDPVVATSMPTSGSIFAMPPQNTITLRRYDASAIGPQVFVTKNGTLKILGSGADDDFHVHKRSDGRFIVTGNGTFRALRSQYIRRVHVYGFGGNDKIDIGDGIDVSYAEGGDGNDSIAGGFGADTFLGGAGNDVLFGNAGDDLIFGNGGRDYLLGSAGNDTLYGQAGIDTLSGASGNDLLIGGLGTRDNIYGGAGFDTHELDPLDNIPEVDSV